MVTFTVTTATNFQDSAYSTRAGNDTYTINGGSLTIDTDTRYCTNATSITGNMGAATISATLGGSITIDGTKVRIIPYSSGSGNVPAIGTSITKGGISGYLLGVWSALNVTPTAAGSAMPTSGWIKVKNVTGGSYSAGTLTGITATATGPDVVGWIEVIGCDATNITVVRLGSFNITGAWFAAGTTNGTAGQTIQLPASTDLSYYAGIYVETSVGSGQYEFWPAAGSQTGFGQNQYQGKVVWISSQGLVTIGNNGSTIDGFTPVNGLHVVVPNVNCINANTTTPFANIAPSSTLTTRHGFATTGGGVISINKANMAWAVNCQQVYSIQLTNTCVCENITIDEIIESVAWSLVGVGQTAAQTNYALLMTLCFAGGTFTDCVFSRALLASSGNYVISATDINGFIFNSCKFIGMATRGNASSGTVTLIRAINCVFENNTYIDGQILMTTCNNLTFTNESYIDVINNGTIAALPMYVWSMSTNTSNVTMDGLNFPVAYCQPYSGILSLGAAGCNNIKLRNLGTYSSPLDLGAARVEDVAWTRSGTTATVTSPSHGIPTTGTTIIIPISSNSAALKLNTAYVVTYVDANTFTFTCTNSGSTSGTISYYPANCAYLVSLAASAAANTVYLQRCYVPHTHTNLFTLDNSSKYIFMDNVIGDFMNTPLYTQLDGTFRGCAATPALTAQIAVYGTHWLDYYEYGIPTNTSSQSWARASTTATITSTGHNMRTNAVIVVTATSDTTAIPLGQYITTVLTSSTFTITVPNAGGASGTISFTICESAISLLMNEATVDTAGEYTINSGTPSFTSAGSLYMPTIGEQITFTTPGYILGHTGFPNALPVMAGGTIGNYTITYAIDKNDSNGYSSFRNFYYPCTGAGGSSGSVHITMTNTTGVAVNDYVTGTNVGVFTKVVSIDTGTQITVTVANTGTVSGTLIFRQYPNETGIDASIGFAMQWSILTSTTNATAITSLMLATTSNDTSRAYQYPLDLVTVIITVIDAFGNTIQNVRVAIFYTSNNALITDQLTDINGQLTAEASYTGDTAIYIYARKSVSGSTRYINNDSVGTLTSSGFSSTIVMIQDTIASP